MVQLLRSEYKTTKGWRLKKAERGKKNELLQVVKVRRQKKNKAQM